MTSTKSERPPKIFTKPGLLGIEDTKNKVLTKFLRRERERSEGVGEIRD